MAAAPGRHDAESVFKCRKDGKQIKDDYDNLKAETKVLNEIIERLQSVEGSNSQLLSEADQLRYMSGISVFQLMLWCSYVVRMNNLPANILHKHVWHSVWLSWCLNLTVAWSGLSCKSLSDGVRA